MHSLTNAPIHPAAKFAITKIGRESTSSQTHAVIGTNKSEVPQNLDSCKKWTNILLDLPSEWGILVFENSQIPKEVATMSSWLCTAADIFTLQIWRQ